MRGGEEGQGGGESGPGGGAGRSTIGIDTGKHCGQPGRGRRIALAAGVLERGPQRGDGTIAPGGRRGVLGVDGEQGEMQVQRAGRFIAEPAAGRFGLEGRLAERRPGLGRGGRRNGRGRPGRWGFGQLRFDGRLGRHGLGRDRPSRGRLGRRRIRPSARGEQQRKQQEDGKKRGAGGQHGKACGARAARGRR